MAVQATPPTQVRADDRYAEDDERGYGWVMFAGVLLLMVGTLNFIEGLAAIGNAHFFVANTHYIVGSLKRGVGSCCASACWSGLSVVACS